MYSCGGSGSPMELGPSPVPALTCPMTQKAACSEAGVDGLLVADGDDVAASDILSKHGRQSDRSTPADVSKAATASSSYFIIMLLTLNLARRRISSVPPLARSRLRCIGAVAPADSQRSPCFCCFSLRSRALVSADFPFEHFHLQHGQQQNSWRH